jgi:protein-L-isoaspartate O-methyltransferase
MAVSSNQNILDVCKERTVKNSPLSRIMGWKCIVNVADPASVLQTLNDQKFHAIIYCGAVQSLPLELAPLLHFGGSLIAPIQIGENQQQFQMIIQETANKREIRKITDFGVIFEKVQ